MSQKKMFSLAMLDIDLRERRINEPIEYFEKWVLYVFYRKKIQIASTLEIQRGLKELFGIEIPQPVIDRILRKLMRKSFLIRNSGGSLHIDQEKLRKVNFKPIEKARKEFERMFSKLVDHFTSFVSDRYKDDSFDRDQAEKLLASYLDSKGLSILKALTFGRAPSIKAESRGHAYYLANFLIYVLKNEPDISQYLEKLIKGQLLYAYLYYDESTNPSQKFSKLDIYLDTPLLLGFLGYKGEAHRMYTKELMRLIKEEGGNLKVFVETLREVERILLACKYALERPGSPEDVLSFDVLREFIKKKYTPVAVQREIETLTDKLGREGIVIENFPKHDKLYEPDEETLENMLKEIVRHKNVDALRHDTLCVSAIYRLRRGSSSSTIENSGAIFLTNNLKVVEAANKWYYEVERNKGIPPAVSSEVLATIAWVKRPIESPDLPKLSVISDCYEMLNPPEDIWQKYLEAIEEWKKKEDVSDEDLFLLKYSAEAHYALMEKTFGDPYYLTVGTIPEILEKVKDELVKRERMKLSRVESELESVRLQREKEQEENRRMEKEIERVKRQRFRDFYRLGWFIGAVILFVITLMINWILNQSIIPDPVFILVFTLFGFVQEFIPRFKIVRRFAMWFARKTTGYDFKNT